MAVPRDSSVEVVEWRTGFVRVGFERLISQSSSAWEYLQSIRKPFFNARTFRDSQQLALAWHEVSEGSVMSALSVV
jgi:hypothetical protein